VTNNWRHNDGGMRRWWNYNPASQNSLPFNKKSNKNKENNIEPSVPKKEDSDD